MSWAHTVATLLEQCARWRCLPLTATGLLLMALGIRGRSATMLGAGAALVVMVLLSARPGR